MENYLLLRHEESMVDGVDVFEDVETETYVVLNPHWNARLSSKEGRHAFRSWVIDNFSCAVGVAIKKGLKSDHYFFKICYR